LRINLTTLDPNPDNRFKHLQTVAAVVYTMRNWIPFDKKDPQTWYPIFLTAKVLHAGVSTVDDMAKGIVADLDAAVEEFKRAAQEGK
jgi:hypothetical protein